VLGRRMEAEPLPLFIVHSSMDNYVIDSGSLSLSLFFSNSQKLHLRLCRFYFIYAYKVYAHVSLLDKDRDC